MKLQIADILVAKRLEMTREARQVDSLVGILRKIADDLENKRAIESDFNIEVEEGDNLDAIDLKLTTYHLKSNNKNKRIAKD